MNNSSAQCHICKSGPFLLSNLYAHLRRFHFCSEHEVNEVRRAIKRAKYRVLDEVKCELCGKVYFTDGGLRKHKRLAHNKTTTTQSEPSEDRQVKTVFVTCPACGERLPNNIELAVHCENTHTDECSDFTVLDIHFSDWNAFELWKTRKERETVTKLVRRTTRKSSKGTTHMYACQHSGHPARKTSTEQERKRKRRCKRNSKHCPCFAKVTQLLDETVDVVACFGHLGHEVNSALLPISPDDEHIVKSMILSGLPFKEIVTQLRITRWNVEAPAEMQPRLCHLTVRDVSNIASRHGLLASFKDDDDVDCSTPTPFLVEEEDIEEDAETNTEYYEESDEDVIVD